MNLIIPESFKLIEQDRIWQLDKFHDLSANAPSFLLMDFTQQDPNAAVVFKMISSLLVAQKNNIPIIFNRTGQEVVLSEIPKSFCIGLFTSGTTGKPKLIFHKLESILPDNNKKSGHSSWLLCYHPMSFAGLQVMLQAIICGDTLISSPFASIQEKAAKAIKYNITAISATPSFIKSLLLIWQKQKPPLKIISCGGEICTQSTINAIIDTFPKASIRHIYATTETGVLFTVKDCQEGFPISWLKKNHKNKKLFIKNNELIVKIGSKTVATGDRVRIQGDRIIFQGRTDNIVNVGGVKVDLDKIENYFLSIKNIDNVRIFAKANPITGYIICAEIQSNNQQLAKEEINNLMKSLPPAERPRIIEFCKQIKLTDAGKIHRKESA